MLAKELIDALAMPDEWCENFDIESNRIRNPGRLLEIGADLVQVDSSPSETGVTEYTMGIYHLAHSSVKDWLQAKSTVTQAFDGTSAFFEPRAHGKVAQDCMQYLIGFGKEKSWQEHDSARWPLATYAALYWRDHLSKSDYSQDSIDWACKLLLNDQARRNWRGIIVKFEDGIEAHQDRNIDECNLAEEHRRVPLAHAACYGLDPVVEQLLDEHEQNVNESRSCAPALQMAVEFDHLSTVKLLLDRGADINASTFSDKSVLGSACMSASLEVVKFMLDHGATDKHIDLKTSYSALACAAARDDDDVKVARLLLRRGHQINKTSGIFEGTALHRAASWLNLSIALALLSDGADKTLADIDGELPLHRAVGQGECSLELAKALYFEGADAAEDRDSNIPLYTSINGNEAVCEMFIEAASDIQLREPNLTNAFLQAAGQGFLRVARFLRKKGAQLESGDRVAIIEASLHGHLNIVEYLLQEGAPVDARDIDGFTPFLCAIKEGHEEVWRFLATKAADIHVTTTKSHFNACHMDAALRDTKTLRWLLDHGVDGDKPNDGGFTPLYHAAFEDVERALEILLEYGADINMQIDNQNGISVAHWAAWNNQVEVLQWLSDAEAFMNTLDRWGRTPFLVAIEQGHIGSVKFLAKCTPNYTSQRETDGLTALAIAARIGHVDIAQWLLESGVDVDEKFDMGDNLKDNCSFPLLDAVFLLQKGANANICDGHGWTPLLYAAKYRTLRYTKLLIQYGASFRDVRMPCGDNALINATENPDLSVLRYFIKKNLDIDVEKQHSFSPLLSAANCGRVEHVKMLHKAGARYCHPNQHRNNEVYADGVRHTSVWYAIRDLGVYYEGLNVQGRYTPLMVSAFCGHLEIVKYFLMHFKEPSPCVDKDGNDALSYACCGGHAKVVEALIESGHDKARPNRANRTVEQEAEKFLECLNDDVSEQNNEETRQIYEQMVRGIGQVLLFLKEGRKPKQTLLHENDNRRILGAAYHSGQTVMDNPSKTATKKDEPSSVETVMFDVECQSNDDGDSDEDDLFLPALSRQGTESSGTTSMAAEGDNFMGETFQIESGSPDREY
ncbi:MAG: hypothetical protein Q9160_008915 [Pyrenula sp. 1 TL-2023]